MVVIHLSNDYVVEKLPRNSPSDCCIEMDACRNSWLVCWLSVYMSVATLIIQLTQVFGLFSTTSIPNAYCPGLVRPYRPL